MRRLFSKLGNRLFGRNSSQERDGKQLSIPARAVSMRRLRCEPLEDRRMLSLTLYVDADAAPYGDGLTWATAFNNLQSALTQAEIAQSSSLLDNVDEIWIAEGTYKPSSYSRDARFSLVDGVSLYGGFAGTETSLDERNIVANTTTLSGDIGLVDYLADNAYTVVYCNGIEASLDGLTITGGNANGGTTERGSGGGIYSRNSKLAVTNCTIVDNGAGYGGGIYCYSSNFFNVGTTLTNCTLAGNSAGEGGGIYCSSDEFHDIDLTLTNSTLTGNSAGDGGGIYYPKDSYHHLTLNNSILWQNEGDLSCEADRGDFNKFISYSGSNNLIGIDPEFVDPSAGDYRLQATSLAINHGKNYLAVDADGAPLATDADGNPRINDTTVDCGAFEYQGAVTDVRETPSAVVTSSNDVFDLYDSQITLREAIYYAGSGSLDATVTFSPSLDESVILLNGSPLSIYKSLVIDASSLTLVTIHADNRSGVFEFFNNDRDAAELNNLTITGGSVSGINIHESAGLILNNCTLSGNSGAGISNSGGLTLNNTTIIGNSGGGIWNGGDLTLNNSAILDNWAEAGGGIYNSGGITWTYYNYRGDIFINNSTLSGNSANHGGGIYNVSELEITNSTITNNVATQGGGIYSVYSPRLLNNTIVAGNSTDIYTDTYEYLVGSNNLIGDGSGQTGLVNGVDGNLVGTDTTPIDPCISKLTQFANGNWGHYLLAGSPAIDGGNNNFAVDASRQPLTEDATGNPRIQNSTVDIGAVEGAISTTPAQTYLVTSLDDTIAQDGILTFAEAFQAANTNQPAGDALPGSFSCQDTIQFAPGLSGTIQVDRGQLNIVGDLIIEGSNAGAIIFDAAGRNRVFHIQTDTFVNLSGITITGGSANDGGGIKNDGILTLTNCTLSNNSADYGGGIENIGILTLTSSTLSGNLADIRGGGIYNEHGTLTLVNSALWNNSTRFGGGIYNNDGILTLTNCTITDNSASNCGGGIDERGSSSTATLNNTIVAANSAVSSQDIYDSAGTISGSHNLIGNGTGQTSLVNGTDGNQVGAPTVPIDPLFVDAAEGDYHLGAGSPAIDAGNNALLPAEAVTDLDGKYRVFNGTVDIGAYEYGSLYIVPGDANYDAIVNDADAAIVSSNWLTQSGATWADGDFNGDGRVDERDAAVMAVNWQRTVAAARVTTSAPAEPEYDPYDLDKDGRIGLGDLALFASVYRQQPGVTTMDANAYAADFNGSGTVDLGDLALFASKYNQDQPADSAVTPTTTTQSVSTPPTTASTLTETCDISPEDTNQESIISNDDLTSLAYHWMISKEKDDNDNARDLVFAQAGQENNTIILFGDTKT